MLDRHAMIPPLTTAARRKIEDAIEALMARLDADDARAEDLEIDADAEPMLGAPERSASTSLAGFPGHNGRDRSGDQIDWAVGGDTDEREVENEHAGDVNDQPQGDEGCAGGCADAEPSHGATTAMNQNHAWHRTDAFWGSGEGEPSLGWSDGRGHPQAAMRGYDADRELEVP